jgi:3'(2'), 5'-bisphosphate nucleotidase
VIQDWERDAASAAHLLDILTGVASQAAAAILAVRASPLAVRTKDDASPVTAADEAAQAIILEGLRRHLPDWPIVSEEEERSGAPAGSRFVLVDPLDGTKEFISGRDDFTVNIALVHEGRPRVGVVGAPAMGLIWRGIVGGQAERLELAAGKMPDGGTVKAPIRVRAAPSAGLTAAVSRSHLDPESVEFLARLDIKDRIGAGSAVKFCRIAEGSADVYPRFGTTCEWDIAAGHAVVTAAGGIVTALDGSPLSYGHGERDFRVPGFIAWGDPAKAKAAAAHGTNVRATSPQ